MDLSAVHFSCLMRADSVINGLLLCAELYQDGEMTLMWAAVNGHARIVDKLLSIEGIEINARNKVRKSVPKHERCSH